MDTGALPGILLRFSRLAGDLPQVAELDLNPVITGPDGARGRVPPRSAQPGVRFDHDTGIRRRS